MRSIKFRGKDQYGGEWWYGSLACFPDSQTAHIIPCGTCKNEEVTCDFVEVNPKTVGQFTGQIDKNGREIFEGDIVRYYDDIEDDLTTAPVVFHSDTCSFCAQPQLSDTVGITAFWQFEVIGNIHDNPELQKGGNNGETESV